MGLLSWIGVEPSRDGTGFVVQGTGFGLLGDIIVGVVGGLLGGFLASQLFNMPNAVNGFNLTSIVVAFLGAILVVAIIRLLRGSGQSHINVSHSGPLVNYHRGHGFEGRQADRHSQAGCVA